AFDSYHATGVGAVFNFFGFVILYFDIIVALLAVPFVFMLVFQEEDEKEENNPASLPEHPQPFYTEPSVEKNDEQPR
ncbi:MAG: hypothetical protein Q8R37_03390, partial [Nanoarchaeota archaeon]|nr:hypothetical protein [Nanoarchaeota archaeon]